MWRAVRSHVAASSNSLLIHKRRYIWHETAVKKETLRREECELVNAVGADRCEAPAQVSLRAPLGRTQTRRLPCFDISHEVLWGINRVLSSHRLHVNMWSTTQEQHEFSSVKVWRFLKVSCWRKGSSVNNSLCWRKSVSKVCLIKHLSQSKFTKCFTRTWDHRREPTIKQTQQQISYRHSTARKKTSFNKWFTNRESIRRVFYRKHLKVPSSVLRPVRPGPESPVSFWVRFDMSCWSG